MPSHPANVKIEWIIENFTCWKVDVHGDVLESPDIPYFPGFKATLRHSLVAEEAEQFELSCVFGEQGNCGVQVSILNAKFQVLERVDLPTGGGTAALSRGLRGHVEDLDGDCLGDHISLRFRIHAPRLDFVSVCMSTTLVLLSDVTAIFTNFELLQELVGNEGPKVILTIRYVRPEGKGEEEQAQLEVVYFDAEIIELNIRGVTKWAFLGLSCKVLLGFGEDENNVFWNKKPVYITFNSVRECGSYPWTITYEWNQFLLCSLCSVRLKFFTGEIRGTVRGGGVWKRQKLGFCANIGCPRPCGKKEDNQHPNLVNLRKELMDLYRNGQFTDFEIRCEGTTISVHKFILSARSPVFRSMLSSGSVDIEDIDALTLDQFFAFLYTGVVDNLQVESALKLYYAADKYRVSTLKTECSEFLAENVSVSNACDLLSLADRHGDDQLTSSVQSFILTNFKEVSISKGWQTYMRTDPELLAKTVTYISTHGYFFDSFSTVMYTLSSLE